MKNSPSLPAIYQLPITEPIVRLGVVADTHIPDRMKALPPRVLELLAGVDLILHAGDICRPGVLDELRCVAPVVAVMGNRDIWYRANHTLPMKLIIEVGQVKIGLTHGHGGLLGYIKEKLIFFTTGFYAFRRYERRARTWFDGVDAIVFGHTHYPVNRVRNGQLLFNPGSVGPDYRAKFGASLGRLTVNTAEKRIVGEILPIQSP
ncbi:MAG TPA: metallophosphoesterase family protein [Anaerolineales bacterium]|nr:metallophosphoesterase family protein [Anaerolineales bacterium]